MTYISPDLIFITETEYDFDNRTMPSLSFQCQDAIENREEEHRLYENISENAQKNDDTEKESNEKKRKRENDNEKEKEREQKTVSEEKEEFKVKFLEKQRDRGSNVDWNT